MKKGAKMNKINDDYKVSRHKLKARLNHWFIVLCFLVTGLSGIAFFFPSFFWLTNLFGSPQMARFIHPFTGTLMVISFTSLALMYWKHNLPKKYDLDWIKGFKEVIKGNEHSVVENGKYNMGQKMLFWTLVLSLSVLLITGFIMWRQYFSHNFSVQTIRIAIVLHSSSAFVLFGGILVHIYMAFWVKGTIRGMTQGWVSARWAKKHHPRWFREDVLPNIKKEMQEKHKS